MLGYERASLPQVKVHSQLSQRASPCLHTRIDMIPDQAKPNTKETGRLQSLGLQSKGRVLEAHKYGFELTV